MLRRHYPLLALATVMILAGSLLAYWTRTAGGTVDVRDVRFIGTNGMMMSGLLYVPEGVTNENPAPGILAIHGYINSRETQDGFAIEFARRGYVVLALDQTGHGYSDPPAFANGFGGPDGLAYLASLDIVDPDNIGLEGHSMGGWANLIAADIFADAYRSIVIAGSSTGTLGAPEGTPEWPRNMGLIFSEYDEFSELMWGAETAAQVVETEKLQTLFGTEQPVEVGRLYGSIEEGTARQLYMPPITHPGDHLSTVAIGDAIEWMQMTLEGGNPLPRTDQIWHWKEIGTLVGMAGMILLLFPVGGLLLDGGPFQDLRDPLPEGRGATGAGWWIAAVVTIAIPILTYYWLQNRGAEWVPPNVVWPQQISNGIMVWAVVNGLIALVLFSVWHFAFNRRERPDATANNYGVTWRYGIDWSKIGKSFLLAAVIMLIAYLSLAIIDWALTIDFRFWVVAFKPLTARRFVMFLTYLAPFTFFFLVLATVLHGQLRRERPDGTPVSLAAAMSINVIILVVGFLLLLLAQYIPLLLGNPLPFGEPLLTIVAFQFVPLLAIVALVSTYFFYRTGHIYVGAFLSAMIITWSIIAGQATHIPL